MRRCGNRRSTSSATRTRRCGGAAGNKADASKTTLLERVNSNVVEHKVKNFCSDRTNGNTLCELISKLEPDIIGTNEANGKPAGAQRIEYAENIAEKMNIQPIIHPKDMAVDEPDELSVMRTSRTTATTRQRG